MTMNMTLTTEDPIVERLEQYVSFPDGLPGFPTLENFRLFRIEDTSDSRLFWSLESLENEAISFILLPLPVAGVGIDPKHLSFFVKNKDLDLDFCQIFSIVTFDQKSEFLVDVQINLKAPLVVSNLTGMAWQVILPNDYPVNQKIAEINMIDAPENSDE